MTPFFHLLWILTFASPGWAFDNAVHAERKCVTSSLSAALDRDNHDPKAFLDVHHFEQIYQERRQAGEDEPTITLPNFNIARNYVLRFPALKHYGFDTGNSTKWHKVFARLEKSSFYSKFVGWDQKLSNGNYARYRYDFEPDVIDPISKRTTRVGRGAHWNIELSVQGANGRRETLKMAVQFPCRAGRRCSEAEALTYLKMMNR
jgi:hypothetical protein